MEATQQIFRDDYSEIAVAQMPEVAKEAPRYLWTAYDVPHLGTGQMKAVAPAGGIRLNSRCIRGRGKMDGFLHRCLVTPMVVFKTLYRKEEIPEGMDYDANTPPVRLPDLPGHPALQGVTGETELYAVWVYPGKEIDSIIARDGVKGIIEITALRGMPTAKAQELDITLHLFPDWPRLPESFKDLISHLEARQRAIRDLQIRNAELLHAIADEMIAAIKQSDSYARTQLDETHGRMSLPKEDVWRKLSYDTRDLNFLKRTGLPRRDEEMAAIARTQETLASNQGQTMTGIATIVNSLVDKIAQIGQNQPEHIANAIAQALQQKGQMQAEVNGVVEEAKVEAKPEPKGKKPDPIANGGR